MTSSAPDLDVDFFGPEVRSNPWPFFARLREADPVHRRPDGDWLLTRYADCQAVLGDPRCSSNPAHESSPSEGSPARKSGSNLLLFLDPPDHTRLRRLVGKAFTPKVAEALRPRIAALVDEMLDEVAGEPTFDLLDTLAYPLPVVVICELLGVPAEDRDSFKEWSNAASRLLDPDVTGELEEKGLLGAMALGTYFDGLFEERRRAPKDDLLSALVAAEEEGDRLSPEELQSITVLLFLAGHETTMNLIGNGTYALLRHPDQLARVRDEPDVARTAIEELLRFDGPVHVTARVAKEDLEVGGVPVPAGERIVVALGAANRDPEQFEDPDGVDVGRAENRHLTFSHGIHFCLGAGLARVEGQVAIPALLRRFPKLELAAEPTYREHLVLRGLTELQVAPGG
ncbi:MAG: cytochrome P450 [Acidimicrobiia bacterium]|nr:cytochrome P450 [Acidimicrobiia bacterium]